MSTTEHKIGICVRYDSGVYILAFILFNKKGDVVVSMPTGKQHMLKTGRKFDPHATYHTDGNTWLVTYRRHDFKKKKQLLLLDEPTNDLDVETLRALEDAITEFAGCVVVISHDRWFLDRIVTHIIAFEGDSQAVWFEGNYEDYEADRHRRLGTDADQPHRIKYKPLKRG